MVSAKKLQVLPDLMGGNSPPFYGKGIRRKGGNRYDSGLLPGDAVARAHAHHTLNLVFWVIGDFCDFDASRLLVPPENIRPETDT
jgi:hypothetical protein